MKYLSTSVSQYNVANLIAVRIYIESASKNNNILAELHCYTKSYTITEQDIFELNFLIQYLKDLVC